MDVILESRSFEEAAIGRCLCRPPAETGWSSEWGRTRHFSCQARPLAGKLYREFVAVTQASANLVFRVDLPRWELSSIRSHHPVAWGEWPAWRTDPLRRVGPPDRMQFREHNSGGHQAYRKPVGRRFDS